MKKPARRPPRRPRKRPTKLDYAERYEVAYLYFFRGISARVLAYGYNISLPYISKIKHEFVGQEEIWLNKPLPEQMSMIFHRGTQSTSRRK